MKFARKLVEQRHKGRLQPLGTSGPCIGTKRRKRKKKIMIRHPYFLLLPHLLLLLLHSSKLHPASLFFFPSLISCRVLGGRGGRCLLLEDLGPRLVRSLQLRRCEVELGIRCAVVPRVLRHHKRHFPLPSKQASKQARKKERKKKRGKRAGEKEEMQRKEI
jgi:hypothetical protein